MNLRVDAAGFIEPPGRLAVELRREGRELEMRIRNNGIGIAPEVLGRLFDPFVQVERRVEYSHGGVGMGPILVRKLVELQGGAVGAYSEGRDRGGEFVVRLPATDPRANRDARAARSPTA